MTQYTPKAAIPYAELTDAPNMQTYAQGLATAIDGQVVAKYATVIDRNTANPTPTPGDMCYCADTDAVYVYIASSAWIFMYDKTIVKAADTSYTNNTTLTLDPHLQWTVEGSSKYRFAFTILAGSASDTPDLNINWSMPAGASISVGMIVPSTVMSGFNNITVNMNALSDQTAPATQAGGCYSGTAVLTYFFTGMVITTTGGTFGMKNSQNVSSASATTVQAHSFVEYSKVG